MKKTFLSLLSILTLILGGCNTNQQVLTNLEPINQNQEIEKIETVNLENLEAKVPILIYHHIRPISETDIEEDRTFIVSPENFEKQLKYLKENGFETISFNDLIKYFSGEFSLPEKPIIISFDDGNVNQYTNALPLLKKYNFKATFFIFTSPIGRSKNYLSWEQVKELADSGLEIGSHGKYHRILTKINSQELSQEIVGSKEIIEKNLGKEINIFSFPFGAYNEKIIELIKEAGYQAVRDITNGVNHTKNDLYHLRAYFVTENFPRFINIVEY